MLFSLVHFESTVVAGSGVFVDRVLDNLRGGKWFQKLGSDRSSRRVSIIVLREFKFWGGLYASRKGRTVDVFPDNFVGVFTNVFRDGRCLWRAVLAKRGTRCWSSKLWCFFFPFRLSCSCDRFHGNT